MTAARHPDWLPDDAAHCDRVLRRLESLIDEARATRQHSDDPADMADVFELVALWARQGSACGYRSAEASTKGASHVGR